MTGGTATPMMPAVAGCVFCAIVSGELGSARVFENERSVAFLDHRPVFKGHVLLAPRAHVETLTDLPDDAVGGFFADAKRLARAVEQGMRADGTFVAMNNRVSQSVPHLHVHVVPRRRKDGLRGFFWPRTRYGDDDEVEAVRAAIAEAIEG